MRRKEELTEFGIMIKQALLNKQMLQTELASQVGVSENYLCFILYGRRSGSKYAKKISEILELGPDKSTTKKIV